MFPTRINSSTLLSVAYERASQTLWLQFHSGVWYRYHKVPASIHQELLAASSAGQYFNRHIRNCYPYQRVIRDTPTI